MTPDPKRQKTALVAASLSFLLVLAIALGVLVIAKPDDGQRESRVREGQPDETAAEASKTAGEGAPATPEPEVVGRAHVPPKIGVRGSSPGAEMAAEAPASPEGHPGEDPAGAEEGEGEGAPREAPGDRKVSAGRPAGSSAGGPVEARPGGGGPKRAETSPPEGSIEPRGNAAGDPTQPVNEERSEEPPEPRDPSGVPAPQEPPPPTHGGEPGTATLSEPTSDRLYETISKEDPYQGWPQLPGTKERFAGHHGQVEVIRANRAALAAKEKGRPIPPGGMVVLETLDGLGRSLETFVMTRWQGMDPQNGDWLYARYGRDGQMIRFGKVLPCIHCHGQAAEQDWLMTARPRP